MNALKAWFLGRLLREKILVLGLVLLGALIWLSSAAEAMKINQRSLAAAKSKLNAQALWLDNRAAIEEAARSAAGNLDASKTFDATFLVAEVTGMARRANLTVNTEPPRTQRSPQFAIHTLQLTTRRAELAAVIRFYQELAAKAPYLGLEQISIQGDRSAPGLLNVTLQITSVELLNQGSAVTARAKPSVQEPAAVVPVPSG
ncbi:MAG: general secretion pathway protein GspM [Verrucomicrobia bacterium]|nr:MAG: general secretion pathway protein GspM [Verrucomicrobiota bacterium]